MPTINEAVQAHQDIIAKGGGSPVSVNPVAAVPPAPMPMPVGTGGILGPIRGSYMPSQVLATDFQKANSIAGPMRSPVFPVPQPTTASKATASAVEESSSTPSSSILLEVNSQKNPNQTVLNLVQGAGIQISVNNNGGVNISSTNAGDGLVHGDSIWEIDSAYVSLRDDFLGWFTTSSALLSESAWGIGGPNGGTPQPFSLGFPSAGAVQIPNSSTANGFDCFMPYQQFANASGNAAWALLEYPNWKFVYNFIFQRACTSTIASNPIAFSMAQTSCYIGLASSPAVSSGFSNAPAPRPPVFIGLRYDTDTTAPSIGDTEFVFEVVVNDTSVATRNNTQGTVVSTGISPVEGQEYRLEILSTTVGQVQMTFFYDTGSVTSTFTVPQWSWNNGGGNLEFETAHGWGVADAVSTSAPFSAGSKFTISGTGTVFDGSWVASNVDPSSQISFPLAGSTSSVHAATIEGYPALSLYLAFGNDTEAVPTAKSKSIIIDFLSFVWNPGVGGGTGTPNANDARYWPEV